MAFCEIPTEAPVQKPTDQLWYCPFESAKKNGVGWAEITFVKCHHLKECRAKRAIDGNHQTSKSNINFRAYPDRTASAPKILGFTVVAHRKNYSADPLLVLSAKRKSEN